MDLVLGIGTGNHLLDTGRVGSHCLVVDEVDNCPEGIEVVDSLWQGQHKVALGAGSLWRGLPDMDSQVVGNPLQDHHSCFPQQGIADRVDKDLQAGGDLLARKNLVVGKNFLVELVGILYFGQVSLVGMQEEERLGVWEELGAVVVIVGQG